MDRFRVVARKYVYFQKAIAKLGPKYSNCNEWQSGCTGAKAQPYKGCPNCEFTIRHKTFLKELDEELRKLKRTTRQGARRWPRKKLLGQLTEVATFANSREGSDPTWSVVVSNLVNIYRSEEAKKRAIDDYVPPTTDDNRRGPMLKDPDED